MRIYRYILGENRKFHLENEFNIDFFVFSSYGLVLMNRQYNLGFLDGINHFDFISLKKLTEKEIKKLNKIDYLFEIW